MENQVNNETFVNKNSIMSKLFNGEELNSDELIFIGKNLHESGGERSFNNNHLPYKHDEKNLFDACSVAEEVAKTYTEAIIKSFNDLDRFSETVQDLESLMDDDQFCRYVLILAVKNIVDKARMSMLKDKLGDLFKGGDSEPDGE